MTEPTYTISPDGKSINCHACGMTSYHPVDVREKFCGRCKVFHGELSAERLFQRIDELLGLRLREGGPA